MIARDNMHGVSGQSLVADRTASRPAPGVFSLNIAKPLLKESPWSGHRASTVMRYGMDDKLGNITYEAERPAFLQVPGAPTSRTYSEETSRDIDHAVRTIVNAAFDKAQAVLTARRETLERGARRLLEKEMFVEGDLNALVGRQKTHPLTGQAEATVDRDRS